MYNTNKAIELIKNIIDNTREIEVVKDSDDIISELAGLHTSILNRDFCWGCKSKICCDLMGVNSLCKAYGDILDCIQDILDKYEEDTNDKYEQHK